MGERLSMLDTMFLTLEQHDPGAHMHIGAALIFDQLPHGGSPDPGLLRELVATRIGILPRFAQRLSARDAGPLTWLTWERDERFDVANHLRHAALPAPGGEAELREWLSRFWAARLDRSMPLWQMVLVDGLADGRWALVTKIHHCLVDGVGSLDIGDVLLDATPDAPLPEPRALEDAEGDTGGGRFWLSPEIAVRGLRAGAGVVRHPRRALGRVRAAAELVLRDELIGAPQTTLNVPLSSSRRYAAVRVPLHDIATVREWHGGTVNDVVLALCTGGLRTLLLSRGEAPPTGLRAQVPVNVRTEGGKGSLGNELTSLFVALPVDEPDPHLRYRRILEATREAKSGTQRTGGRTIVELTDLAPPVAGEVLARLMFGSSRMFNLTVTNVPGPRQQRYALGARLVEILPLVPLFAGHAIGIAVVSYAGTLAFGLNADRVAAADVEVLEEGIRASLQELVPRRPRRPRAASGGRRAVTSGA